MLVLFDLSLGVLVNLHALIMLCFSFEVLADFGRVIRINILNISANRLAMLLKMLT